MTWGQVPGVLDGQRMKVPESGTHVSVRVSNTVPGSGKLCRAQEPHRGPGLGGWRLLSLAGHERGEERFARRFAVRAASRECRCKGVA
jgi:hypothetical protein